MAPKNSPLCLTPREDINKKNVIKNQKSERFINLLLLAFFVGEIRAIACLLA
ncbi:MAG: hypothetical protein MGG37_11330 [Trichodesmium sp. MAG_R01]|nr:hypothetical protein [Trichodesmium sp. MAG_R01]